jgi:hypothetical protein
LVSWFPRPHGQSRKSLLAPSPETASNLFVAPSVRLGMSEMLHGCSAETTDRWFAAHDLIARESGEDEEEEEVDEQQREEEDEDEDDGYSE